MRAVPLMKKNIYITYIEPVISLLMIGTASGHISSEADYYRRVQVLGWGDDGTRLRLRPWAFIVSLLLLMLAVTIAVLWITVFDKSIPTRCGVGSNELLQCVRVEKIGIAILIAHFCAAPAMVLWSEIVGRTFTPMMEPSAVKHLTKYPRIAPALTGVFERGLLTPLFIALWGYNSMQGIGAIAIVYIGIRTFRVDAGDGRAEHSSLHSIWNSSISVGFAIVAGWAYWQV